MFKTTATVTFYSDKPIKNTGYFSPIVDKKVLLIYVQEFEPSEKIETKESVFKED